MQRVHNPSTGIIIVKITVNDLIFFNWFDGPADIAYRVQDNIIHMLTVLSYSSRFYQCQIGKVIHKALKQATATPS